MTAFKVELEGEFSLDLQTLEPCESTYGQQWLLIATAFKET